MTIRKIVPIIKGIGDSLIKNIMKKNTYLKFILYLILQLNTTLFFSQTSSELNNYYTWFDWVIGEGNTSLYNGTNYIEKYITEKDNHKFFLLNEYTSGNLVYNNQAYYNIYMKYDLYEDDLIVKLPNESFHLFIKLIKEKVDEFTIKRSDYSSKEHRFISNSKFKNNNGELPVGFYEVIEETSSIILLQKHHKSRTKYIESLNSYSKFSESNYFAILFKNNYYKIDSKKDLINLFPDFKKNISTFYRKEWKLFKTNKEVFFTSLVNEISTLIANSDIK